MVLGILTLLPPIYALGFLGIMASVFVLPWRPSNQFMALVVLTHVACMLLLIGLLVFYLRHVLTNSRLRPEDKTLWVVLLVFAGAVSMPIYWYYHVRHLENSMTANAKAAQ
jgi:hypothetical protein